MLRSKSQPRNQGLSSPLLPLFPPRAPTGSTSSSFLVGIWLCAYFLITRVSATVLIIPPGFGVMALVSPPEPSGPVWTPKRTNSPYHSLPPSFLMVELLKRLVQEMELPSRPNQSCRCPASGFPKALRWGEGGPDPGSGSGTQRGQYVCPVRQEKGTSEWSWLDNQSTSALNGGEQGPEPSQGQKTIIVRGPGTKKRRDH